VKIASEVVELDLIHCPLYYYFMLLHNERKGNFGSTELHLFDFITVHITHISHVLDEYD